MEADAERTAQVMREDIFSREALLVGTEVMAAIAAKKVVIFGVGGEESCHLWSWRRGFLVC